MIFFWKIALPPSPGHMVVFQWLLESIIILAKKIRECVLLYIFFLQKSVILDKFLVKKTLLQTTRFVANCTRLVTECNESITSLKRFRFIPHYG